MRLTTVAFKVLRSTCGTSPRCCAVSRVHGSVPVKIGFRSLSVLMADPNLSSHGYCQILRQMIAILLIIWYKYRGD